MARSARTPRSRLALLAAALLLPALVAPAALLPASARASAGPGGFGCLSVNGLSNRHVNPPDDLLAGRLTIPGTGQVSIGTGPVDWSMDPYHSSGWRKLFLSLKWVESLTDGYRRTGDAAYLRRATEIVRDFATHVPPDGGRWPEEAWDGMYTGQRATVLSCLAAEGGFSPWLTAALGAHGRWLAAHDPGDWNQGVNAALGLLAVACTTGSAPLTAQAQARFDRMARTTLDAQGAVGEQSTGYLQYLLGLWDKAVAKLPGCGGRVPAGLPARQRAARDFLAWATTPGGTVERLGDTDTVVPVVADPTPALTYALSAGADGAAPAATTRVYSAGYVFGRSAWAPFASSLYWTQRFGPGRAYHGHADHLSLTLWDRGAALLVGTGYATGPYREWLRGPFAANATVAAGAHFDMGAATSLTSSAKGAGWFATTMADRAWDASPRTRSTLVDTAHHVVLVLDHARRTSAGGWQQLWHLPPRASVTVRSRTAAFADVPGAAGRVAARLHVLSPALPGSPARAGAVAVVRGGRGQVAGRLSPDTPGGASAPVVVVSRGQRTASFLTVLVAGAPGSTATATLRAVGRQTWVDVRVDGVVTSYRVTSGGLAR